jgi:voltage-gated potassium channel
VTLALLRAALTSTVLVVLYYTVPVTGAMDASATALLLAGLLVFVVVITWQVRAILGSRYPALRAVEALASAIPLFLLLFALVYLKMADAQAQAFSEPLTRTDSLYFTVTVFSTVGFGDITPKTQPARVMTMVQMLGDLVVVGLVLQVMVGAVKAGLRRREAGSARFAESSNRGDAGQIASPYVPEQGSEP